MGRGQNLKQDLYVRDSKKRCSWNQPKRTKRTELAGNYGNVSMNDARRGWFLKFKETLKRLGCFWSKLEHCLFHFKNSNKLDGISVIREGSIKEKLFPTEPNGRKDSRPLNKKERNLPQRLSG